jgi:hypothetical protein
MGEYFNEYQIQYYVRDRQKQLLEEARQFRLKAQVLAGARNQRQLQPPILRIRMPNLLAALRAGLQNVKLQSAVRHCARLGNSGRI